MICFIGIGKEFGRVVDWPTARAARGCAAAEIARAGRSAGESEEEQIRWLFSGNFYEVNVGEDECR